MAKKRFTDAEIWDKKWFRKLSPTGKLLWNYLKDKCDNAGVLDFDDVIASTYIGLKVSKEDALTLFGDRVVEIQEDKLYISSFCDFQYGELSEKCNPHKAIIKTLKRYDLYGKTQGTLAGTLGSRVEEQEQEQEQEQKQEQEQEQKQNIYQTAATVLEKWNSLPLKKAKAQSPKTLRDVAQVYVFKEHFGIEGNLQAFINYSNVINSDDYWYSMKFSLVEFLGSSKTIKFYPDEFDATDFEDKKILKYRPRYASRAQVVQENLLAMEFTENDFT